MEFLLRYIYIVPSALIAIVLHELSHGLVSHWLGDPTPKETGRLSLNPLKHLDPVGTIALIIFGFGWAKPVIVNPEYYKHPKWGMALVGLAGPLMNFLLSCVGFLIMGLIIKINPSSLYTNSVTISSIIFEFCMYFAIINLGLCIFNLVPIPPLDGSKILGVILPRQAYREYMSWGRYGMYIVLGFLLIFSVLERTGVMDMSPISFVINFVYDKMADITIRIFA